MNCFFDWNKRKAYFLCETDRIGIKPYKIKKWARKSIHHNVLLWDKEIQDLDPNNFVINSTEPYF